MIVKCFYLTCNQMSSMVNMISHLFVQNAPGTPRAPCFPHACFCQINFDVPQIIESLLNFKWATLWGRNSQSILQSRDYENGGIKPGRINTAIWRKGFLINYTIWLLLLIGWMKEKVKKKATHTTGIHTHLTGAVQSQKHPLFPSSPAFHQLPSPATHKTCVPTDTCWSKHSSSPA